MNKDEAAIISERMCLTEGCTHRSAKGYIYCVCCLYGECIKLPSSEVEKVLHARKLLDTGSFDVLERLDT